jgi:hypothetical protein
MSYYGRVYEASEKKYRAVIWNDKKPADLVWQSADTLDQLQATPEEAYEKMREYAYGMKVNVDLYRHGSGLAETVGGKDLPF